ncbi:MAG: hypothetical protein N2643_00660 [Endomicrobia bacterium]|nr:hypothetical protein [Endomicrobiia bacterium]
MVDEEEKFYTWDEIEKELSELELQYGDSDEIVKNLVTPSVSAYWKKKLEEEKILYEKMLQTKEEEKKQMLLKLQQQLEIVEDLKKQIEKLEKGEYEKLKDKYEELRIRELELEKEKEKLVWQQQIQGLEFDKKVIEQEIEKTKKEYEQQKQELLVYYNRQFNSLLEVQKQLIDETNKLEQEIDEIVSATKDEIAKVNTEKESYIKELKEMKDTLENMRKEKELITNEKNNLLIKIDNINKEHIQDKKQLLLSIVQNVKNYTNEIRSLCGLIIGATNFMMKYPKFKKAAKFHQEIILNSVQRIVSMLDEIVKSIIEFSI